MPLGIGKIYFVLLENELEILHSGPVEELTKKLGLVHFFQKRFLI